jgi:NADPH2:quinone reductase
MTRTYRITPPYLHSGFPAGQLASGSGVMRMQAWRVHEFGEPRDTFVLDEVPEPTRDSLTGLGMSLGGWVPLTPGHPPYHDWVLMEMSAAALALPDVTMSRGTYPVPVTRPYTSGQEGVGVVTDASGEWEHLVGKRVVACCIQPFGSLAPVAVGVGMIFEVPDSMADEDAAAYLIAAHTGYHAAIRRGQVTAGEDVAVLGAAGGLGSAIVQLCLARGARTIAVVGSDAKADACRALGAEAIVHTKVDAAEELRRHTGGRGVDVIVDPVQGEQGAAIRKALAVGGRHVLCGHAGGLIPHDPDFYLHNHSLIGVDLGGYPRDEMQRMHAESQTAITTWIAERRYRPLVGKVVDFADVPAAIDELANRETIGRTVVRIPR